MRITSVVSAFLLASTLSLLGQTTKGAAPNLKMRLEPQDVGGGLPGAFIFELINVSDHNVRVPAPTIDCA